MAGSDDSQATDATGVSHGRPETIGEHQQYYLHFNLDNLGVWSSRWWLQCETSIRHPVTLGSRKHQPTWMGVSSVNWCIYQQPFLIVQTGFLCCWKRFARTFPTILHQLMVKMRDGSSDVVNPAA